MHHQIKSVVVTGGRKFTDAARIEADLRALLPLGLRYVAEGECPLGGADTLAYDAWHMLMDQPTRRYPMRRDLDGPGRAAYLRRNIRMLEAESPDLVLAYPDPDSRGTWHCVAEAVLRGFPVAAWVPWAVRTTASDPDARRICDDEMERRGVSGVMYFYLGGSRVVIAKMSGLVPATTILNAIGTD